MPDSSILADVDKLIDEALGLKDERLKYHHKETCQLLSKRPRADFDGKALIQKILDQIESKWDKSEFPSAQNWRWKKNPKLKTESEEVILERWIVRTTGDAWVNQVPVASGLTRIRSADPRTAIDLVHRCEDGWYEFIELKVNEGGGTPIFAAMEILQYGVLYIFSRENASRLGYEKTGMLGATGIRLKVLAPASYYDGYDLSWLEESINSGLAQFLAQGERGFKMNFTFEFLSCSPVTWRV